MNLAEIPGVNRLNSIRALLRSFWCCYGNCSHTGGGVNRRAGSVYTSCGKCCHRLAPWHSARESTL